MDSTAINQTIQYIAWFLAIAELIVGLYILALNPRHTANRLVGIFLLLSAINSYALGMMVTAGSPGQAQLPAIMLAMTTSATEPLLLLCSVALLRPRWLTGELRRVWLPVYALVILPAALTMLDLWLGTSLWFTGIDPASYGGGFLITPQFTSGSLSIAVRAGFILSFLIISLFLSYVALIDKKSSPGDRKLAWLLLLQQLLAGAILTYFGQKVILPSLSVLLANTIFVITYAYAAFGQMISARSRQSGSLQTRLTLVVLLVALPVMVALTAFIVDQAQRILEADANQNLATAVGQLELTTRLWSENQERLMSDLASRPQITSMQAAAQRPFLQQFASKHPEMISVFTLDLEGRVIASSDDLLANTVLYAGWFEEAVPGAYLLNLATLQDAASSSTLVSAVPIQGEGGQQVGVLAVTMSPIQLGVQVGVSRIGKSGYTYVINAADQLVAYLNESQEPDSLDFSQHPGVTMLRQGSLGPFTFSDPTGMSWRAKAGLLPNGWGVVAQIPEGELLGRLTVFGRLAWFALTSSAVLLLVLAVLMIRQTIRPIRSLMQVSAAVTAGDLNQTAPVESDDEIGALARSYNSMTDQIRGLVSGLERRVVERTQDLERRAVQLQVAAEVAREAASIRDVHGLLENTAKLISDRFGFYHAGIFIIDRTSKYAVLAAASSEGGRRMLERQHQLKLGKVGIVGHVAASGEPRIALDVGKDAVFFNNPDLPETHSEIALPMKAHGLVIGVLDVQSTQPAAFSEEDIDILQVLADQVALALENARLLQASEKSLLDLEQMYKKQVGQVWENYLDQSELAFTFDPLGVQAGNLQIEPDEEERQITAPILLHGNQIGSLQLMRAKEVPPWNADDQEILEVSLAQVALALESARIQEMERQRAHADQVVSRITARTQSALDVETVMKRAVEEIGKALRADKVQVVLGSNGKHASSPPGNGSSGQ